MQEKIKRNKSLWEYHLKHPQVSCAKLGRIFQYKTKDGKQEALDPAAVWRILKRMENHKVKCFQPNCCYMVYETNLCTHPQGYKCKNHPKVVEGEDK